MTAATVHALTSLTTVAAKEISKYHQFKKAINRMDNHYIENTNPHFKALKDANIINNDGKIINKDSYEDAINLIDSDLKTKTEMIELISNSLDVFVTWSDLRAAFQSMEITSYKD